MSDTIVPTGLPDEITTYVDPDNTYKDVGVVGENFNSKINMANEKIFMQGTLPAEVAGIVNIVEQYTVGDQTVTKWSNGDMEIIYRVSISSLAINVGIGSQYESVSQTAENYIESFVGNVKSKTRGIGSANFFIGLRSGSGLNASPGNWKAVYPLSVTATNVLFYAVSRGKWK